MDRFAELREEYGRSGLTEADLAPDPVAQFRRWYADAERDELPVSNAMVLATTGADGRPSARVVLLKGLDERGFRFFTNYASRKGRELDATGRGALLFHFTEHERQVRVEGPVERTPDAESDAYFAERPRESQLGAWASAQSEPVAGRADLEAALDAARARFPDAVPRPPGWGGYRLAPERVEFWQGRHARLHDRLVYRRDGDGWRVERLQP